MMHDIDWWTLAGSVLINPPWRYDLLQNIININWGGLAVEFGDKAEGPPKPKKT